MGTADFFPRVKRAGREADHSTSSVAVINNAWNYTSIPPYVFMACCKVKHKDSSIILFRIWKKQRIRLAQKVMVW
jgi:hypothetical protein